MVNKARYFQCNEIAPFISNLRLQHALQIIWCPVVTNAVHKDLGIILSADYEHITSKAYRMFGLLLLYF